MDENIGFNGSAISRGLTTLHANYMTTSGRIGTHLTYERKVNTHTPLNSLYELAEAKESKDLMLAIAVFGREYLQPKKKKKDSVLAVRYLLETREMGFCCIMLSERSSFWILAFSVLTRGEGAHKSAVPWEQQKLSSQVGID